MSDLTARVQVTDEIHSDIDVIAARVDIWADDGTGGLRGAARRFFLRLGQRLRVRWEALFSWGDVRSKEHQ